MSPRKNHPQRGGKRIRSNRATVSDGEDRELSLGGVEEHDEGLYRVRRITGSSSNKPYRCPGCDQLIPTATPHIVAWPHDDIELRRHWHTPCWNKRDNRRPNTERSRNAPRF